MDTNHDEITKSCFDLSVALMWEKNRLNSEKVHSILLNLMK